MANYKQHTNKHLVSAKEWLTRAQQSFEKEKDVRGELDLFLAQAELAHAKKASRLRHRFDNQLLKSSMPLLAALFVVAIGLGANYWLNSYANQTMPLETIVSGQHSSSSNSVINLNAGISDKTPNMLQDRPGKNLLQSTGNQAPKIQDNMTNHLPTEKEGIATKPLRELNVTAASQTIQSIPNQPYSSPSVPVSKEEKQKLIRSAGNFLRNE